MTSTRIKGAIRYLLSREEDNFIIKDCFICKTRGHILSHRQLNALEEKCKNKKGQINWKKLEDKLEDPEIQCNVCHGEGELVYPYLR